VTQGVGRPAGRLGAQPAGYTEPPCMPFIRSLCAAVGAERRCGTCPRAPPPLPRQLRPRWERRRAAGRSRRPQTPSAPARALNCEAHACWPCLPHASVVALDADERESLKRAVDYASVPLPASCVPLLMHLFVR
jgi:hypothetical protein